MSDQVVLTLYIAGANPRSERAIQNIHQIGDLYFAGRCLIQIIDVLLRPDAAETARIMATPTLVRELPQPERRVIGDLSDQSSVLKALSIHIDAEP